MLNTFQAPAYRDEQEAAQLARLEERLQYVETAAAEERGRHDELYRTTNQVQAAEANAAHTRVKCKYTRNKRSWLPAAFMMKCGMCK